MMTPRIAELHISKKIVDEYDFLKKAKLLPRLWKFVENANHTQSEKITRWMLYMYDVHSPFVKMFDDFEIRAKECARDLGFYDNLWKNKGHNRKDEITRIGKAVFLKEDPAVQEAALRLWRYQDVPKAIQYFSYEEQLVNTLQLINEQTSDKDLTKRLELQRLKNKTLREDVSDFVTQLGHIRKDAFMGDVWLASAAVKAKVVDEDEVESGAVEDWFADED